MNKKINCYETIFLYDYWTFICHFLFVEKNMSTPVSTKYDWAVAHLAESFVVAI